MIEWLAIAAFAILSTAAIAGTWTALSGDSSRNQGLPTAPTPERRENAVQDAIEWYVRRDPGDDIEDGLRRLGVRLDLALWDPRVGWRPGNLRRAVEPPRVFYPPGSELPPGSHYVSEDGRPLPERPSPIEKGWL